MRAGGRASHVSVRLREARGAKGVLRSRGRLRRPVRLGARGCRVRWVLGSGGAGRSSAPFLEGEQRKGSKLRGEVTGDTEHSHPTQLEEASGQGRFSEGHGLELEPEGGVDHRQAKGDRQRVPGGGERVGEGLGRGGNCCSVGGRWRGEGCTDRQEPGPGRGGAGAGSISRCPMLEPSYPLSALPHGEPANRKCKRLNVLRDPVALRVNAELLTVAFAGPQGFTRWAG